MKLKEVKCGSKFKYKGYEFTKLVNEKQSCYCLLNDTVFKSEFGETNDWAKSTIRKRLNKFDDVGNSFVLPNINKDDLVAVSLNYYAFELANGRTKDYITLLSWEEWYAFYYVKDFNISGYSSWLRSGGNNSAYNLNTSGGSSTYDVTGSYAVRPALHLKKELEVEL